MRNSGGGELSDAKSKDSYKQWSWLVKWGLSPSSGVLGGALLENPLGFPSCLSERLGVGYGKDRWTCIHILSGGGKKGGDRALTQQ